MSGTTNDINLYTSAPYIPAPPDDGGFNSGSSPYNNNIQGPPTGSPPVVGSGPGYKTVQGPYGQATLYPSGFYFDASALLPDSITNTATGRIASNATMEFLTWDGIPLPGNANGPDTAANLLPQLQGMFNYNASRNGNQATFNSLSPEAPILLIYGKYAVPFRDNAQLMSYVQRSAVQSPMLMAPTYNSANDAGHISDIYHQTIGRDPTSGELSTYEGQLQNGTSLSSVRMEIATSQDAGNAVSSLYSSMLGAGASQATVQGYEQQLTQSDVSLNDVRSAIAASNDAITDLSALYSSMLGTSASPSTIQALEGQLTSPSEDFDTVRIRIAASPEVTSAMANLYESMLGTSASAETIQALQGQLTGPGETFDTVRNRIAASPEAITSISGLYTSMLGVSASPSAIQGLQMELLTPGETYDNLRTFVAASGDAISALGNLYGSMLGDIASPDQIRLLEMTLLTPGETANDLRTIIAASSAAINKLGNLYAAVYETTPTSADIQKLEIELLDPSASYDQIVANLVTERPAATSRDDSTPTLISTAFIADNTPNSTDHSPLINQLFQQELGRLPTSVEAGVYGSYLDSGANMSDLQRVLATSREATNNVYAVFEQVLGRDPEQGNITGYENALEAGYTPADVLNSVAHSQEATNDLYAIFDQVLGRDPSVGDVTGYQSTLEAGISTADVRNDIAHSGEAASRINDIFQQLLGRDATADETTNYQSTLSSGQSLSDVQQSVANSDETAGALTSIFQNNLDYDPTPDVVKILQNILAKTNENLDGVDTYLAQFNYQVSPIPVIPLPPIFIPGSGDNEEFVRTITEAFQNLENAISNILNAKPPSNIEPITNPPQNPVIPPGWVSVPGRVDGSTVYYPPDSTPNGPDSIRVMPPGSSPVPGLENGYWVEKINRQPIDPSTGKPAKGRNDSHVPLPESPNS